MRNFYVDAPWGQIHCRSVPADASLPLFVLLHQSPLSARNYDRLLPLLSKWCRPVAVDTPGYGASDPPRGEWQVSDYARVALRVADALNGENFHLFGRATGAVFAYEAAMLAPDRVRSLILHGVPVYSPEERADRLANFAPPYSIGANGEHLQWIWSRIRSEYPALDPEIVTRFVGDYLAAGGDFATAYRAIWRYDLPARAAAGLMVPLMLIGGGKDRIGFMHARAAKLFADAWAEWLVEGDDFEAERSPERFGELLRRFIFGVPRQRA
jgi:haloalkane dehalogenase